MHDVRLSLSARRAWIEIFGRCRSSASSNAVALRKESVDRNLWWGVRKAVGSLSLSARRAWIEMQVFQRIAKPFRSLSARRAWIEIKSGLQPLMASLTSLSARRAWIEI